MLCKLTWLALTCVQKCHNGENGESGAKLPEALQKFKSIYHFYMVFVCKIRLKYSKELFDYKVKNTKTHYNNS